MGVSIDHIPNGWRTTDRSDEKHGTQPPGNGSRYGTQPPPTSDRRLKRKVESLYGTQPPPAESDARLKRDVRPIQS
jgi:hypothetical protein